MRVSFFQLNDYGLVEKLPTTLRETLGTYHFKSVIFDDTIMLTGANLSQDYFTNRKD